MYEEFAAIYDRFMNQIRYAEWADLLLAQFAREGLAAKLRILDAACGTGGLSIPFARAGHTVVASDSSEKMLIIAAEKARVAGVSIPFVRQDLRELSLHRQADVINCACDGVNYLTSEKDVRLFFRSAFSQLRPGGLLCFDVSSRYKLERVLAGNAFGEDEEDATYLWQNAYDENSRLLELRLVFFMKKGEVFLRERERQVQRAHDEAELTDWLRAEGFADIKTFALTGLDTKKPSLEPVQNQTERIAFFARKPLL